MKGTFMIIRVGFICLAISLLVGCQNISKEELAALKLQMMTELRKKRFSFRDEVLQGIQGTRDQLISEVSEQISSYSKNIKNQVEGVDRQRDTMMLDIESNSMKLRTILSKVEAL